ncbi:MAG: tetratricopeptide repeat protein, partial [Anaerolineae bacterium]|nr:tetratricopeptide repeat protein [Anaerolineae bacterium]
VIYWIYGHNHTGETHLLRAFQLYHQQKHIFGMARCLNNLAHYLYLTGRFSESVTYCKRGLEIARTEDDFNVKRARAYLQSNMASALFALEAYDQAERCVQTCLEIIGEDTSTSTTSYAVAKFIEAEITLHRQQFDIAWPLVNLAYEYAAGTKDSIICARTCFVQAHIASCDQNPETPSEVYYNRGREFLNTERLVVTRGRICMEEARYQMRHGHLETARQWAEEARQIFVQAQVPEEITLAEAILSIH